jgi:hypothetical protein
MDKKGEIVITAKIVIGADRRQGTRVDPDEGAEEGDAVAAEEVDDKSARR